MGSDAGVCGGVWVVSWVGMQVGRYASGSGSV